MILNLTVQSFKHALMENYNTIGSIDYIFLQNWHRRIGKIIVYLTDGIPWNMTFKEKQLITVR